MNKKSNYVFLVIIILLVGGIFTYSLYKNNKNMKVINNIVKTVLNSEDEIMLYIGSSNCDACDIQSYSTSLLLSYYKFNYMYIDFNEISTRSKKLKLLSDLSLDDEESFTTPTIAIYKNGKIVDKLTGVNSTNKLFDLLNDNNIIKEDKLKANYLSLSSFINKLESNNKSVVVVSSSVEKNSINLEGILWKIASDYNAEINFLMVNEFSNEELETFESKLDYYRTSENGLISPELLIIENGNIIDSLSNTSSEDEYVDFLKENGIIS